MEPAKNRHIFPSGQKLEILQGDITQVQADAIVNAANAHLQHGGGVAAAIVRRGGWVIQEESLEWVRKHGPISHGHPAYTAAGKLNSKYVIHAVGPLASDQNGDQKLMDAVRGSLNLAAELNLTSIAFPAISTGIFGFPKDRAARIFMHVIRDYFTNHLESQLKTVQIVLYDDNTLETFQIAFDQFFKRAPTS